MPDNIKRNTVKRAVRAGSKPVIAAIKANAPVGETGNLQKSIGKKEKSYRRSETFVVIAGPQQGAKVTKSGRERRYLGHHGSWLEVGTQQRYTKGGAYRGFVTATHFVERAFDSTAAAAKRIIIEKMWEGIRREAAKHG
jgi:HK97 gp10 family phage protein